ncbi:MAG: hypothetical protein ACD_3C00086G0061 [uncultured bacterium (gcode 4)]|uniref:HTH tetR-type domain-containing protein n=1 Tax=uncultured bacterium (gcode 4) TaxID=1234023 RepID=K2G1V3_9BACT|nr:MAG: hypothetical protein ACD_3C00086G0061 [uncultured bacterium (gcode 4)]
MKTELLQKIEELFWENAFAELSMDDVGKNLWIKKSSIYYHFPSKDQMFYETLEYSSIKYLKFLDEALILADMKDIVKSLIDFPFKSKNLFAVVLQKGYCKNEHVKDFIINANLEISKKFTESLWIRFSMNKERIILFRSIIDDLWKKNCTIWCGNSGDFESVANEIVKLFSCKQ